MQLITVITTNDVALIALIKSVLEGEGIDYFIKGESLLTLGSILIPAEIQVDKEDYEEVKELLKGFM
ncbi:hypothetical protein OXPF_19210 [Oxobacter pfennigii]|uniref:DUF2007 domain-containing protein n=1 Tax=Oxobacter pfennigii TaxID=36849 RepID=A0A0P8WQL3_9CLOT|nr:DUF2007 domain-containing protein [Oxobacter pfennigii]KPU44835.1 hypothetical protein OXPF_19210 [Oxobacter pfennigii]